MSKNEEYPLYVKLCMEAKRQGIESPSEWGRKQMELLEVLHHVPDGYALLDDDSNLIWSSRSFHRFFPDAAFGKNIVQALKGPYIVHGNSEFFSSSPDEDQPITETICTNEGVFFNVSLQNYEFKPLNKNLILVSFHESTEANLRREKLKSLHEGCVEWGLLNEVPTGERESALQESVVEIAKRILEYEVLELRLLDDSNRLTLFAQYALTQEAQMRYMRLRSEEQRGNHRGIIEHVAERCIYDRNFDSYLCDNTSEDPYYLPGGQEMKSSLTIPIVWMGKLFGILNIENSRPNAFAQEDLFFAEIFAHEIAIALNFLHVLQDSERGNKEEFDKAHLELVRGIDQLMQDLEGLSQKILEHIPADNSSPEALVVQKMLYDMHKRILFLRSSVYRLGSAMEEIQAIPPLADKWLEQFQGKSILIIESSPRALRLGVEVFTRLGCQVDIATSKQEGINFIQKSFQQNNPYYVVNMAAANLHETREGRVCPSMTDAILEVCRLFPGPPPVVLLQEEMTYLDDHAVVNSRAKYRNLGLTSNSFVLTALIAAINKTLGIVEGNKGRNPNDF
ncbi:MAG: GAF domain-containing protein [Planctomycetia bacterium]|nr:GAF domain-containing protein [Planctomycetia bacterium]